MNSDVLADENARLKREIEDLTWASQKTNEGIRLLYKNLERQNVELKSLDQMKTKFLATVSHELRTPITIILHAVENIMDGAFGKVNDKQKTWLARIDENALRLGHLVNDILDLSKLKSGTAYFDSAPMDLGALVSKVCANMQVVARLKKIVLSESVSAAPRPYTGAVERLEQVLTNLIGNAIKFTPENGSIEVSIAEDEKEWRVCISDTGPGIDPQHLEKIFSPFVQVTNQTGTQSSLKGVGLGLAICHEIVMHHGGRIWAESEPGCGSRFIFALPKHKEAPHGKNTDR